MERRRKVQLKRRTEIKISADNSQTSRVVQTDRGEELFNVVEPATVTKIVVNPKKTKNVSSHEESHQEVSQDQNNYPSDSMKTTMLQSKDDIKNDGRTDSISLGSGTRAPPSDCTMDETNMNAGIDNVVSCKADENSNQMALITLKVDDFEPSIVVLKQDNDENAIKVNPLKSTEKDRNKSENNRDESVNAMNEVLAANHVHDHAEVTAALVTDHEGDNSEISDSNAEHNDVDTDQNSNPVLITVCASSDTDDTPINEPDDDEDEEFDDYESIVDKVLWTDDLNIHDDDEASSTELINMDSDEDEGASSLASSIRMFFEAYEAQLKNQQTAEGSGNTPPSKMSNYSPPYIAGLSPVSSISSSSSTSSHHLRIPGGSGSGERGLVGFRSREQLQMQ